MGTGYVLAVAVGALLYYLIVLRRFRSLGFRIFSLTTFLSLGAAILLFRDHREQRSLAEHGETIAATVVGKSRTGNDSAVTVEWAGRRETLSDYIAKDEYENFAPGQTILLRHNTSSGRLFVKASYERMVSQTWILYVVTAVFFLLGCVAWIVLGRFQVGVDQHGNEWLEDDAGNISLDERASPTGRFFKRTNLLVKLWQILSR